MSRRRMKSYPPFKRLKICSEFFMTKTTAQELADKYHISRRTLFYWLRDYISDYAACLDFYEYIMGDLSSNGFPKAAEYMRDYAVDILTDFTGGEPPEEIPIDFTEVLKNVSPSPSGDEIADGISVFNKFKKGNI